MAVQASPVTSEDGVRRRTPRRSPWAWGPGGAAALSGLITFAVTFAWSWRPCPWLDEQTTVALVKRSWTDLFRVIWVRDAPIGPYYVLLKIWMIPGSATWWLRMPTILAVSAAAALLTWWLTKVLTAWHGVAAGLVLAALPATTRQAQEIRPYGLVIFSGVLAAVTWWLFLRDPHRRTGVAFALAVALLPAWHALSLTLVPALVLATVAGAETLREGVRQGVRVAAVAAAGLVLSLPFTVLAFARAVGVGHPPKPTLNSWWVAFQNLVTPVAGHAESGLWWGGVLVAGGLVVTFLHRRDRLVRESLVLLVLWAVLHPLALLVMGTHGRPSVLIGRYMMLALPAWAGLAGVGIGGLIVRLAEVSRRLRPEAGTRRRLAGGLVGVLLIALCAGGLAERTWDSHEKIRAHDGHGAEVRPVMERLRAADYADLPVLTHYIHGTLAFQALAPDLAARLPLWHDAAPRGQIVVGDYSGLDAKRRLRRYDRVLLALPTFIARTPEQALTQKPQVKDWTVAGVWKDNYWIVLDLRRPADQP